MNNSKVYNKKMNEYDLEYYDCTIIGDSFKQTEKKIDKYKYRMINNRYVMDRVGGTQYGVRYTCSLCGKDAIEISYYSHDFEDCNKCKHGMYPCGMILIQGTFAVIMSVALYGVRTGCILPPPKNNLILLLSGK